MKLIIALFDYGLVALFGILLSAGFSGISCQKQNLIKLTVFSFFNLILQTLCWAVFGLTVTTKLYPFITHLPLLLFLMLAFKQPLLKVVVSILLSYLCCQIPRWVAAAALLFSDDPLYQNLLHIAAIFVALPLLLLYAVKPTVRLLSYSRQSALVLGIVPLMYYVFDYATTVYTDLLYSGNPFSVQFMPSVMATFYFFFLLVYHSRLEHQEMIQRERDFLSLRLRQSESEFSAMGQMQEQTRQYRHDLRHHFALLLELAESGEIQKIKDYLCHVEQNLNAFSPKRFCGNDVINLVLSHFAGLAERAEIALSIDAVLPASLPFEATELCCLLSNGLENAILAAKQIQDPARRRVCLRLCLRQKNLLLSIQNPYTGKVTMTDGMPVAAQAGHGLGTKSIVSIVNAYHGQVSFSADGSNFLLRVMLPMKD